MSETQDPLEHGPSAGSADAPSVPGLDAINAEGLQAEVTPDDVRSGALEDSGYDGKWHELGLKLGHQNHLFRKVLIFASLLVIFFFYLLFVCLLVPMLRGAPYENWHWLVPLGLTGAISTTLLLVLLKGVFYADNKQVKPDEGGPEFMPVFLKAMEELAKALVSRH